MTGPAPDVAEVRVAVRDALADLSTGDLVLVACSGGADSLALAAATGFVAPRAGLRAGAVVVDHSMQQASAQVARAAAEQCRGLGLDPVEVVAVQVGAAGGPEAAARTARYAALEDAARRHDAAAVLLGHTLDDQAETVLLGLARGSGARSLSGMAPRRGLWRRPLLAVRRTTTEAACAALGLQPWSDPTNDPASVPHGQEAPLRSRVRHDVLPVLTSVLGPGVPEALARTAELLRDDADVLDLLAADLLERARDGTGPGDPTGLDVEVLADAPDALRRRALREAIVAAGSPAGSVHRVHVEAVDALLTRWTGQGPITLPGGVRASRTYGRLTFVTATS